LRQAERISDIARTAHNRKSKTLPLLNAGCAASKSHNSFVINFIGVYQR
jgi:hypothetical protein